jgi:hypothetical protein
MLAQEVKDGLNLASFDQVAAQFNVVIPRMCPRLYLKVFIKLFGVSTAMILAQRLILARSADLRE